MDIIGCFGARSAHSITMKQSRTTTTTTTVWRFAMATVRRTTQTRRTCDRNRQRNQTDRNERTIVPQPRRSLARHRCRRHTPLLARCAVCGTRHESLSVCVLCCECVSMFLCARRERRSRSSKCARMGIWCLVESLSVGVWINAERRKRGRTINKMFEHKICW